MAPSGTQWRPEAEPRSTVFEMTGGTPVAPFVLGPEGDPQLGGAPDCAEGAGPQQSLGVGSHHSGTRQCHPDGTASKARPGSREHRGASMGPLSMPNNERSAVCATCLWHSSDG